MNSQHLTISLLFALCILLSGCAELGTFILGGIIEQLDVAPTRTSTTKGISNEPKRTN